jgi:hypothetical protein
MSGWEQSPHEDNRVELSKTEFDETGAPRIELHWKKGDIERRTVTEGIRLFGETMLAKNLGARQAGRLAGQGRRLSDRSGDRGPSSHGRHAYA